tara:strand:+ start:88 stop:2529 length:2442 start_codon:yes stop_codon:yes gene_type:complete
MAYIEWWNRTGPATLGERFGLEEIFTARKTLSPTKSHPQVASSDWYYAPPKGSNPDWPYYPRNDPEAHKQILEDFDISKETMHKDGGRIGFRYGGNVMEFILELAKGGKKIKEILLQVQTKFGHLKKGLAPADESGVINALKKVLGKDEYAAKYAAKRITAKDIENYKKVEATMSEQEIAKKYNISTSTQTLLRKKLNLGKKKEVLSKKFTERVGEMEKDINDLINVEEGAAQNFSRIYSLLKDKTYLAGATRLGKPSEDSMRKIVNRLLMDKKSLSVEAYKTELRKMIKDRTYDPGKTFFDPLGILKPQVKRTTGDVKTYPLPNLKLAKEELRKEIQGFDKLIQTNTNWRKTHLGRDIKEAESPILKQIRIGKKKQRQSIRRAKKTSLSEREKNINLTQYLIQKQSNNLIKTKPDEVLAYLKANPDKLKMLGTRVNRQTGEIYYETPNLSFLNKNIKDTQRFFEMDHGREISKGKYLLDVPENRYLIPRTLHENFKKDAQIVLEKIKDRNNPIVKKILAEAKKVRVRLRPNVDKGIYKTEDFYQHTSHPLKKINESIEFWLPDHKPISTPLPTDKTGKVITNLMGTTTVSGALIIPTLAQSEEIGKQIIEPSDKTQEASVIGDVAKGTGAIALGTAIVHPKETGELAKKVLTKAGKILAKPIALTALPFWKAKQVIGETIKSVKEKKLPDYELTDPNTWMHAAFWNWAVKEWGLTKTLDQFSKANIPGKAKILSHVVARGGLNPNLVKFISSRVAWPVAGIMSVHDAYKDYQRRKPFIEEQKELIEQGVVKEEEFDKEEPMFAMGGIASLIK